MLTNCFTCDKPISEKARFCGKCGTNVRCKNCNEDLHKEDIMCEGCGQEVVVRQEQNNAVVLNHIKYEDAKKGISLDARITDNFGANAAAVVGMLRGNPMPMRLPSKPPRAIPGQEELFEPAEFASEELSPTDSAIALPVSQLTSNPTREYLHSLFEQRDEQWILTNPNLKAKSKSDFVKRVVCLFLQFQLDNDNRIVSRNDTKKLLENCSVYDGNARDWFAREKLLIHNTANDTSLLLPGKVYVGEILQELLDESISSTWKIGNPSKAGRKSSKKKRAAQLDEQPNIE